MNKLLSLMCVAALLLCFQFSYGQDKIVSKTGKIYEGYVFKIDSMYISFRSSQKDEGSYSQLKLESVSKISWCETTLTKFNSTAELMSESLLQKSMKSVSISQEVKTKANELEKKEVILNTYSFQQFSSDSAKRYFMLGMSDARKYYHANYLGSLVFVESLLLSEVSLFTTAIASNTPPNEVRCLTDDYEKFNNKNYSAGYKNIALKKKRRTIWVNWTAGSVIHVAVIVGLIVLL